MVTPIVLLMNMYYSIIIIKHSCCTRKCTLCCTDSFPQGLRRRFTAILNIAHQDISTSGAFIYNVLVFFQWLTLVHVIQHFLTACPDCSSHLKGSSITASANSSSIHKCSNPHPIRKSFLIKVYMHLTIVLPLIFI